MLPPSWKAEIEETVEKAAHSASERQKTENDKNASEIASAIKALNDAYQAKHNKPEKPDKVKRALDVASAFLLFFTALFTGLAWWVFRDQLHEMQNQTLLSNPPKLLVRQLIIEKNGGAPTSFKPGDIIEGWIEASNGGTATTKITHWTCFWWWYVGDDLPMRRPYDPNPYAPGVPVTENDTQRRCSDIKYRGDPSKDPYKEFEAGAAADATFKIVVPKTYTPEMNLYVLGHINAEGILNTKYVTLFIRKYDLSKHRFVTIKDNADYGKYDFEKE